MSSDACAGTLAPERSFSSRCDDDASEELFAQRRRRSPATVGIGALMPHTMLEIETADGTCPTHAYYPEGSGHWPAVVMFIDGIGMRRALEDMAARLSSSGYYVLLPDLFYRIGYKGEHGMRMFSDPAARED